MSSLTSSLVVKLIDGISAPARKAATALSGIGNAAARINGSGLAGASERLNRAMAANAERMDAMRGRMIDAAAMGYTLVQAISAPVQAAVDFESAMADVRKVVDFPTPQAFAQMGKEIRALALEMPMAADGIAAIVAAAGQSGLARDELLGFAEMAAKVGVAWEVSADKAGESLAKLKTSLGRSVADTGLLADAINHLGNNTAASAPDILDMVRRVAGSAKQFGFTAEQAAAFGSAMIGSGFESEVAATSFLNMGRALTRGASATTRQREALGKLGLESTAVSKRMQKDAVGTVLDVMQRLNKLPAHLRASVMSDFFGDEARALTPLITNSETLAKTLRLIASETEYAGSAAEEYSVRAQTTANNMQLFRNRVRDLAISIGDALIPGLNRAMDRLGPIVTSMSNLAQQFPEATAAIVTATATLFGFRVAAIAAGWAATFLRGGMIGAALATVTSARKLGAIGGFLAAPFVFVARRLKGFGGQARSAFRFWRVGAATAGEAVAFTFAGMGAAILRLLNPLRLVRAALRLLRFAMIGTGIGALLVGLGLAAEWVANNWKGIQVAWEAFKGSFMRGIEPVKERLRPILDRLGDLSDSFDNLTAATDNGTWAARGIALGQRAADLAIRFIELVDRVLSFVDRIDTIFGRIRYWLTDFNYTEAGRQAIQSLWDGMVSKFEELLAWVKEIPSRIVSAIGSIDLSGMIQWPSMPSWLGGGKPEAPAPSGSAPAALPARARGGHVKAGHMYRVNDDGSGDPVELFRPGKSGTILPSSERRKFAGGGGPAGPVTVAPTFNITVNGGTDTKALALEVARLVDRDFQKVKSGLFANLQLRTI